MQIDRAAERWDWQARTEAWDAHLAGLASAMIEAEGLEVLSSGLALKDERVRASALQEGRFAA